MTYKFLDAIKTIFNYTYVGCYTEDEDRRTISFDVGSNNIDYDKLEQLSKLLGTTKINFCGDKEIYHLSEITTDTELSGELFISGVKFV